VKKVIPYWHLGTYHYIFYRYVVNQVFQRRSSHITLDAGCGDKGSILTSVEHLVGVDISTNNILTICKTKQGDFIVASLTHLPFRPEVFDMTVCVDVLEHVTEKKSVFAEIARVSRQGAHFVGSTSNQLNPLMLLDSLLPSLSKILAKYVGDKNYERHSRLNVGTLPRMMKDAGFDVYLSLFGFPPFQPWVYECSNKKLPWFSSVWILLDKLTNHARSLKETMVFEAVKQPSFSLQQFS
jgi:ubiquinone/menaquinone biosynthesis C-methylase UbiE